MPLSRNQVMSMIIARKNPPKSVKEADLSPISAAMDAMREGITPKKGVDYMTSEEIEKILKAVTPIKGKHYFTDEEIKDFGR